MLLKGVHLGKAHTTTSPLKRKVLLPSWSSVNKEQVLPFIICHRQLTIHLTFPHTDEFAFFLPCQQDIASFFYYQHSASARVGLTLTHFFTRGSREDLKQEVLHCNLVTAILRLSSSSSDCAITLRNPEMSWCLHTSKASNCAFKYTLYSV